MPKYLSGRSKVTPQSKLQSDRYRYLSIENAEPNLGDPLVGLSSVTAKPVPPGQQFIVVSVEGSTSGERYWIPNQGGIIPGSISVFDDNILVGALSSITQLNFVGAAITASVSIASSNLATIRVFSPGNNQEIIFNTANEFSTSTKLKFDPSIGLLTAGDRIIVGAGGTVITTTGIGSVGIGTTNPTQELHIQGDLRLTGTIYDSNNQPGTNTQLLVKNNFGGLTWINQGTIRAGAGGTYQNIQFHNNAGLVDGAPNLVFDDVNSRIGIGSTQPKVLLDVLGISSFKGGTTIDNLNVTGVTTTRNLTVTGVSTIGFVTGTSAFFTGIVTATKFVGELNVSQLYVTGVSTFLQKVNINSDLGITGITTTQNLQVYQSTTLNRLNATGLSTFTTVDINGGEIDVTRIGTQNLNVSGVGTFSSQVNINNLRVTGVGTFDNIKIYDNNIETTIGNLIIDSSAGTTQINDAVYVNDATQSTSKDTGSIITEGGVGIEKDLYVGGPVNLATSGGITTTGGDLYVNGDLYVSDDIIFDELQAKRGTFAEFLQTKDFNVTGLSTFSGAVDINASADISTNLTVGGTLTANGNVDLGNATTDTVTFTARVDSNILPSTNNTRDLGSSALRWNNVYATTFNGTFVGTADNADKIKVVQRDTNATHYLTFVSNDPNGSYENLYGDDNLQYNPQTNILTVPSIKPTGIQDSGGGTGSNNFVLTANGSGGWTWKVASTSSGSAAIGGITVQEEGSTVGTAAGITTVNFIGGSVTATSPTAGTANISVIPVTSTGQTIDQVSSATATAQSTANTAVTNAATAQSTANTAVNGLSNLDASNITTGTISDDRLPETISSNITGTASTSTNADKIKVAQRDTNATHYLTFVSNDPNGSYENLYGDDNLQYNPETNILTVAGEIRSNNNIIAYFSDERLKENIRIIPNALEKLLSLRGVTFNSNNVAEKYGYLDKKEQIGVIAQDVEKVIPQVVLPAPFDTGIDKNGIQYSKSGENYKTVQYDKIIPLLIEAIKEQQQIIENLQKRIKDLENN
jgi:hypothetical protein